MSRIAVFGYGSLVDPQSVARTLGKAPDSLGPARLRGWRRRWSLVRDNLTSEKTFARRADGELLRWVLGLNIERQADPGDAAPNGALLEVTEAEIRRLDLREMRYDRVDVTGEVDGDPDIDRVFTYTAKSQHFAPRPPEGAVVIARYVQTLEAAFVALGPDQWELFLTTTGLPPVEQVEAELVRDHIPPGNPREW